MIDADALCACGHRNGEHVGADGLGECDVSVRPGELCPCEGFRAPAYEPPEVKPLGNARDLLRGGAGSIQDAQVPGTQSQPRGG